MLKNFTLTGMALCLLVIGSVDTTRSVSLLFYSPPNKHEKDGFLCIRHAVGIWYASRVCGEL